MMISSSCNRTAAQPIVLTSLHLKYYRTPRKKQGLQAEGILKMDSIDFPAQNETQDTAIIP